MISQNAIQKIKNVVKLKDPTVKSLALKFGILKGRQDYTRFIILGRSRTGSNFLRGLIKSNPAVITLGEVFRNQDAIDMDHPEFPINAATLNLYQTDPLRFYHEVVFRKAPAAIDAVGFKLFYYHARTAPFDQLWSELSRDTSLHVIHIKRRNILKTHISRENAEKSGSWVNTSGVKEDPKPLRVEYAACLEDFTRTRQWETDADRFFQHHPLLQMSYEELVSQTEQEVHRIQDFLGLAQTPVVATTFKQSQKSLAQAIENFDELKRQFTGSPWAEFFNE